jgi:hypothetical protein
MIRRDAPSSIGSRTKAYVPAGMLLLATTSDRPGSTATTGQPMGLPPMSRLVYEVADIDPLPFGPDLGGIGDPGPQHSLHPVMRVEPGAVLAHLDQPRPDGRSRRLDRRRAGGDVLSVWLNVVAGQRPSPFLDRRAPPEHPRPDHERIRSRGQTADTDERRNRLPVHVDLRAGYGRAACNALGRNISRFQPATPTTSTSRTISGQLVSQIHSPIITGRNNSQTTT